MGGKIILLSTLKLLFISGVMGIAVYLFNMIFFNPLAPLTTKIIILSTDIMIGITIYGILSRLIQNEELSFLINLIQKRKNIIPEN